MSYCVIVIGIVIRFNFVNSINFCVNNLSFSALTDEEILW